MLTHHMQDLPVECRIFKNCCCSIDTIMSSAMNKNPNRGLLWQSRLYDSSTKQIWRCLAHVSHESWAQAFPLIFFWGERGMFGVWHVLFVDEGFLWGVRSRSLLKLRDATVYCGWAGVCRQLHGMAKPLSCCLDFFFAAVIWSRKITFAGP